MRITKDYNFKIKKMKVNVLFVYLTYHNCSTRAAVGHAGTPEYLRCYLIFYADYKMEHSYNNFSKSII